MEKMIEFTKRDGSKHRVSLRDIEGLSWWNDEDEAGLLLRSGDSVRISDRPQVMRQISKFAPKR